MSQSESFDPARLVLDNPVCPKCGTGMWLSRIEPDAPGHDKRTFECSQCANVVRSYANLKRDLVFAVFAIAIVAATSILGQIATYPNLIPWYAALVKPDFDPPNWVFAPVWTTLYVLMAFALWRILRVQKSSSRYRHYAIGLFLLLLSLNAAWSWMFFWAHSPLLGLVNIVPHFIVILATIISFAHDGLAAICLLPLAAWVAFATVLNTAIWLLNS